MEEMDVRYERPSPDKRPCPVCEGAGYWYIATGSPCYTEPPPAWTQRCPFCLGSREWHKADGVT